MMSNHCLRIFGINPFPENTDKKSFIYSHWTITHVSSLEKNEELHCLEDKPHLFYHSFWYSLHCFKTLQKS